MRPIDFSDRRTRTLTLIALLGIGLGAGMELALWLRGGGARLTAGPERARARVFMPAPKTTPPALAYEDLLGLFARHQEDPAARAAAAALLADPGISQAWHKVEEDHDVDAFANAVKSSPAYGRFTSSKEFGRLSSTLGSDSKSGAFFMAFGVPSPPSQSELLAAAGPFGDGGSRVTSGGPINLGPAARPRATASPLTPPVKNGAAPGTPPAASAASPASPGAPIADVPLSSETGAKPPEPKAKPDSSEPCPMQRVCSERAEGPCPADTPPADFTDARRQACACAIEELKGLMKADGNGTLLAALTGEGGFTPLLRQTDAAMVFNARGSGRCYKFRALKTPELRAHAAEIEASVWRVQIRKQLRAFAKARDIPFQEPEP